LTRVTAGLTPGCAPVPGGRSRAHATSPFRLPPWMRGIQVASTLP